MWQLNCHTNNVPNTTTQPRPRLFIRRRQKGAAAAEHQAGREPYMGLLNFVPSTSVRTFEPRDLSMRNSV